MPTDVHLYIAVACMHWLFLLAYHITNIRDSSLRPLFGVGYFFVVMALWVVPQPRFILGRKIFLVVLDWGLLNILFGTPFLVVGVIFGLGGVLDLGIMRTSMLRHDGLICSGVYRYVRHPQYFGVAMLHVGIALLFGEAYNLIYSPFMFLAMYLKALTEEKYLKKKFGKRYDWCFSGIPRFIPRLSKGDKNPQKITQHVYQ